VKFKLSGELSLFVRPCWIPKSEADTREIIDQNPWAQLVSQGNDGPLATNLPLLVEKNDSNADSLVLTGHMARANEHLAQLMTNESPVLAIFEGPWSYVTASWYPNRQMPSTYYYTAVHCYGRLEFQDNEELDASLEELTQRMEAPIANGWRTSEIQRSEITRRFAAIKGFRMIVSRMEAKFKLGQDEPFEDASAVADVLASHEVPRDQALAEMIRKQNAGRS
jgi:transcriptional regulator